MSDDIETRYFLLQGKDRSWSICDRQITKVEKEHRIVTGLNEEKAMELIAQLNGVAVTEGHESVS